LFGYVRGRTMNANSLAYLPGLGTFQMSAIHQRVARKGASGAEEYSLVQAADGREQETLDAEAAFDEMNAEQTWPTERELEEAQARPVRKRVPRGTSEYQAAWILESEDEEGEDDGSEGEEGEEEGEEGEDGEEGDDGSECSGGEMEGTEDEEEMETMVMDENNNETRYMLSLLVGLTLVLLCEEKLENVLRFDKIF
jgi:pre-rRNA-processing protein TSR1